MIQVYYGPNKYTDDFCVKLINPGDEGYEPNKYNHVGERKPFSLDDLRLSFPVITRRPDMLIAEELCGVQPLSGPPDMKTFLKYKSQFHA